MTDSALPLSKEHAVPAKAATVAMWLFLASLTMLFASSMVGYVFIRVFGTNSEDLVRAHLPLVFAVSTLVVMAGSVTVQQAVTAIRRERQGELRRWLWITFALAVFFCVLQAPGLVQLWKQHVPRDLDGVPGGPVGGANLARLIAVFIVLHALHVIGGVVYIVVVLVRASRGVYDHEHYVGVKHAALYWHFLDAVWLFMYGLMLVLG